MTTPKLTSPWTERRAAEIAAQTAVREARAAERERVRAAAHAPRPPVAPAPEVPTVRIACAICERELVAPGDARAREHLLASGWSLTDDGRPACSRTCFASIGDPFSLDGGRDPRNPRLLAAHGAAQPAAPAAERVFCARGEDECGCIIEFEPGADRAAVERSHGWSGGFCSARCAILAKRAVSAPVAVVSHAAWSARREVERAAQARHRAAVTGATPEPVTATRPRSPRGA